MLNRVYLLMHHHHHHRHHHQSSSPSRLKLTCCVSWLAAAAALEVGGPLPAKCGAAAIVEEFADPDWLPYANDDATISCNVVVF